MPYNYYCTSCETKYHNQKKRGIFEETIRERYNIPSVLFSPNPRLDPSAICPRCANEFRYPYLIYLGPGVSPARAMMKQSIHFTSTSPCPRPRPRPRSSSYLFFFY